MPRIIYAAMIFLAVTLIFLSSQCKQPTIDKTFVRLEGKNFVLDDTLFYPIILNYSTTLFRDSSENLVLGPYIDYELHGKFENSSKDAITHQVLGHMKIVREMGFNTVRICLDNDFFQNNSENIFVYRYFTADKNSIRVDALDHQQQFFNAMAAFISVLKSLNLRAIILISPPFNDKAKQFTVEMLKRFANEPTIMAYDFFNEPLYFHKKYLGENHLNKKFPVRVASDWKKMMREFAPNQLFTLAFAEPIEVFHWDPSLIPVDFVQVHTYHPLRVPSELYWYTHYVNKPIVIGETSLPADNDSIFYEEQRQFMIESFKMARSWGISGYGWWTFQEVDHGNFEHSYTGIINRKGTTITADGKHTIIGTLKPAAFEVKNLLKIPVSEPYPRPVNYFNMLGYENYLTRGKVVDSKGKPIEGAVIRGWTKYWKVGMNTYTDNEGNFTLYSNDIPIYFAISAPGKTMVKFDTTLVFKPVNESIEPEKDFPNRPLEYHSICFTPFLKFRIAHRDDKITTDNYIFNLDTTKFFRYRMESDVGTIRLKQN